MLRIQLCTKLDHFFKMKSGSIGDPDMYLGAKLRKVTLENGVEAWATSALKYVQEAVSNPGAYLHEHFGGSEVCKENQKSIRVGV